MADTYNNDRDYLSFTEKRALNHFLNTIQKMKVMAALEKYTTRGGSFAEYLMNNNLAHYQLKYLFMTLGDLEDKIHVGNLENKKRFHELRPGCAALEAEADFVSCF